MCDPYFRPNMHGRWGLVPACRRVGNGQGICWSMNSTARRGAFLLIICGLTALAPAAASAASSKVFTVANYPVEATAKDAVAAKEKAHADGQQAALGALLKRLVPVTAYNRIDHLKSLRAANFIDQAWLSCRPPNTEAAITDHWNKPEGCDPNGS